MSRNGIDTSAIVVENRRIQECFPKVEPEPLLETGVPVSRSVPKAGHAAAPTARRGLHP
jgi:hypothetical protein